MPILKQVLGKTSSDRGGRSRNYIANRDLGTDRAVVHENVIDPGVTVPWHYHASEEVIVVLEGQGECRTEAGSEPYRAGDVIILPAHVTHSLSNIGDAPIRQLCFFPDNPATRFMEQESS
jgi:quercetin dioxygenase-like cupin family protein